MQIIELSNGLGRPVLIELADDEDIKLLTKRRYSFAWNLLKGYAMIYKLRLKGSEDILGVMGLMDVPDEKRIEIRLLASSKENIGKYKLYDGIAGCLIAFAGQMAINRHGADACISLVPKSELVRYYINKYGMLNAGRQLYLEGIGLETLVKKYLL